MSWRPLRLGGWTMFGAGAVAVVLGGAAVASQSVPGRMLLAQLSGRMPARAVAARLSTDSAYAPCAQTIPSDGTIPKGSCGFRPPASVDDDDAAPAAAPDAHVRILAVLRWQADNTERLDDAIAALEAEAEQNRQSADFHADLAAAYLARAGAEQSPLDLLRALEAGEKGVALDRHNRAALFNRALAADWLALTVQARGLWTAYLEVDDTSQWADEARGRLQALAPEKLAPQPTPASSDSAIAAFVRADPQRAWVVGWDTLLARWGSAVTDRRPAAADSLLRLAERVGTALGSRPGGDASLADAVRAIRASATKPDSLLALARAHVLFAQAHDLIKHGRYEDADPLLEQSASLSAPSPTLSAWTAFLRFKNLAMEGDRDRAKAVFAEAPLRVDSLHQPELDAHVKWGEASLLNWDARSDSALERYEAAARSFDRAGDRPGRWTVEYLKADAQANTGEDDEMFRSLHRALWNLRPYPSLVFRKNSLDLLAKQAADKELYHAADRVSAEAVLAGVASGTPSFTVESLIWRARFMGAARVPDSTVRREVRRATLLMDSVHSPSARNILNGQVRIARALALATQPRQLVDSVNRALPHVRQLSLLVESALKARAEAKLRLGWLDAAVADVDDLVKQAFTRSADSRASAGLLPADDPSEVIGAVVVRLVEQGRQDDALGLVERRRGTLAPSGPYDPRRLRHLPTVPAGRTAIRLLIVGDDVLAWAIRGRERHFVRTHLAPGALEASISRVQEALQAGQDEKARPELTWLYDVLIRPVRPWLGRRETTELVVMTDGVLKRVPYAALRDTTAGEYLVERQPIRGVESILEAVQSEDVPVESPKVLVVANPAFDRAANRGLDRLPGAQNEADSIRSIYPGARILKEHAATPTAFLGSLKHASVVDFAGHAIADERRPDRSYLLLAPDAGARPSGRLMAASLDTAQFKSVRLVVLSACESLSPGRAPSGAFAGLSGALLGAGAHGVVGSLWPVSDSLTPPLIGKLFRAYSRDASGARALRAAQIEMLHRPGAQGDNLSAWAAFLYAGR